VQRVAAVGIAAVLLVAAVGCSKGSSTTRCQDPTQASSVELKDFAYSPVCTAAASSATLTLSNTGSQPHSFTVKGTRVDVMVPPGQHADASLAGIPAGTYEVVCTLHPQMVAALRIG
jgi:plastocyanin